MNTTWEIVTENARPSADSVSGAVCKSHPEGWQREVNGRIFICTECVHTLARKVDGAAPTYTVKANRRTVHIAGLQERTAGTGAENGGVVSYYAQSACAGLTRSGQRMEALGSYDDLATALKRAEQATYSISGRKVCKTCLAAAQAEQQN